MKNLILVRHAKSSWKYDLKDRDRPLKKSGMTDASLVSSELLKFKIDLDFVCSSPAKRAKNTYKIFCKTLKINEEAMNYSEDIYDFGGHRLTHFIAGISDAYKNVMLFGHNHAITAFVNTYGSLYIENVPTCGLIYIEFDIEQWSDLRPGVTKMTIFPRDLR